MPQAVPPNVTIGIGIVEPTDNNAKFVTGNDSQAIWTDYYIQCRLEKDFHRHMLGVSSPNGTVNAGGATVAFVQLAYPTVCWVADWTAARSKSKPTVPSPEQIAAGTNAQWVLLDETLEPGMVAAEPNGTAGMYRISGTYVYGALKPNQFLNRDAVFPLPPWLSKSAFDREVSDDMFESGLINTANPQ